MRARARVRVHDWDCGFPHLDAAVLLEDDKVALRSRPLTRNDRPAAGGRGGGAADRCKRYGPRFACRECPGAPTSRRLAMQSVQALVVPSRAIQVGRQAVKPLCSTFSCPPGENGTAPSRNLAAAGAARARSRALCFSRNFAQVGLKGLVRPCGVPAHLGDSSRSKFGSSAPRATDVCTDVVWW